MEKKLKSINSFHSFKVFFKKYRKRIVLIGIGIAVSYYLYKKFLSERVNSLKEMYNKISDLNEIFKSNNNIESFTKQYEVSFNNLISRLLDEVGGKLELNQSVSKLFSLISTANKEDLLRLWVLFKNATLISFYSSIFITRILLLLSQTHLLILERLQLSNEKLPQSFYEELLTELWQFAMNYIDYLVKNTEDKLCSIVDKIILNRTYPKERFIQEFRKFRNKVEEIVYNNDNNGVHLIFYEKYISEIENKINALEKMEYINEFKSLKMNCFLNFYSTYYDIITSNIFQVITIKALDYDFLIIEDLIEMNFENEKKNNINNQELSVAKIISFLYKMRTQITDHDNTIFLLKNYKNHKFPEDLNEYFKVIYD